MAHLGDKDGQSKPDSVPVRLRWPVPDPHSYPTAKLERETPQAMVKGPEEPSSKPRSLLWWRSGWQGQTSKQALLLFLASAPATLQRGRGCGPRGGSGAITSIGESGNGCSSLVSVVHVYSQILTKSAGTGPGPGTRKTQSPATVASSGW